MDGLLEALAPWYFWIKAFHVLAVAVWSFSTMVAWVFYLKPALLSAQARPDDPQAIARRNEFMERFDRGAILEHIAFVILVVTALLMIWLRDIDLLSGNFIAVKFWIGVAIILPMEAIDIWISHLGGNKEKIRRSGDTERYEAMMAHHWRFFRITEPIVVVLVPLMFFLAVLKPF